MKDTKLVRFLTLFTKEEFKKFGLFVSSPYFNRLNNVTRLYRELKKYHPDFKSKGLTKENIFCRIFPHQKYDDIKMRALFSYLLSLAEKFLASESIYADNVSLRLETINVLQKKGSFSFSGKILHRANLLLRGIKARDSEYYYTLFKVLFHKNTLAMSHFSRKINLQKENDALTVHFIATVLRTYGTAFNTKSSFHLELRTDLIDLAVRLALMKPYKRIPIVKMNYTLYMILRYHDEKYFFEFLNLVGMYPFVYTKPELLDIQKLLANFCVLKIQKGFNNFVRIKFELYKSILAGKLIDAEKYIDNIFFNNIVTSALQNNDSTFAETFINNYKERLNPDMKKDVVEISYAKLYYHLKQYRRALEHLSRTGNNEDVFYKFAIKDLNIKIFYETGEYEPIFSIIDSYKHFLHNNNIISEDVKKKYRMYLNNLGELLKLKISPSKQKAAEIQDMLKNTEGFVYKSWIEEKLNEF